MLRFLAWDSENRRAWWITPTVRWYRQHDNGCAVSIGYRIGKDITMAQIERFKRLGRAEEANYDEAMAPKPW